MMAILLLIVIIGGPVSAQAQASATPIVSAPPSPTEPEVGDFRADLNESDMEAHPSIICIHDAESMIVCSIAAGLDDVAGGTLTIDAGPRWGFAVNGIGLPESGAIDLSTILGDLMSGRVAIAVDFPIICPDPSTHHLASIAVDYTYVNAPAARAETTIALAIPVREPVPPEVTITPIDFGTLTWDVADGWPTGHAATTVAIARDGCGDLGAFDIRIHFTGEIPGFAPILTGVTTTTDAVLFANTTGDPNAGPVTIAHIATGFTGTTELALTFDVAPDDDFVPGHHEMGITVTAVETAP